MTRTRKAGKRSTGRKGAIKLATGLGSRGVRDVGRGVGRVVGYVPIVGKPGRKVIDVGSRMAGDAVTLVGDTTDRAAGIITTPLAKLLGMKKRTRKRTRKRMRRRHKRSHKRKSRRRSRRRSRRMSRRKRRR
jgi:hypothetical protein